jgi:uncharacterized protein (DUF2237 family)
MIHLPLRAAHAARTLREDDSDARWCVCAARRERAKEVLTKNDTIHGVDHALCQAARGTVTRCDARRDV